ncbi:hypothetical protein HZB02_07440 [Candidatus Woesearchaeota archaeon]|nr:hypothetical protein [Candidatus Woesearchaeota archaeon]
MTSGSSVYKSIKSQLHQAEQQQEQAERQVYELERNITTLTAEQEECFVQLAIHYLPQLEVETLRTTLHEIQDQVRSIFSEKQEKRQALERQMAQEQEKTTTLGTTLETVTAALNKKVADREGAERKIVEALATHPRYQELDQNAGVSHRQLQQCKKRVVTFTEEAKTKLVPYDESVLFRYLVNRGFGSANYTSSGIVRRLDTWVAEIVNFAENKKNYDFLRAMPELMDVEVKRQEAQLQPFVQEMQSLEQQVAQDAGLNAIDEEMKKLAASRKSLIEDIRTAKETYQSYEKQRTELDSSKDPYHEEAISRLKGYLQNDSLASLKERARQTPGTEDDRLVQRLEAIDAEVRQYKDNAKDTKKERDDWAKKVNGLQDVESKFRRNDYESSRSTFSSDFEVDNFLTGYIAGRCSIGDVLSEIDRNQEFKPVETYHSSSSYSTSSSSMSTFDSGGFGSGGFSDGGGIGGGGFSDGGGF